MSIAGDALPLRPLSIGEIFDRTVTLYVRYFGLFTLIMLVVVLPLTVASYFSTYGSGAYQQVLQQATHPSSTPSPVVLSRLLQFEGILMLVLLLQLLLLPFANAATASAVADLYRAKRPTWRQSYAAALRRWPAILGATVLNWKSWLLALALCVFAMGFAFISIVVEDAAVFPAISSGFARIFNRGELGRAVLVFLALIAISIGLYIVLGIAAALAQGLTHSLVLYGIVTAPISILSSTFTALLFAVYYFDVRVRREGLDMQTQLDRLE